MRPVYKSWNSFLIMFEMRTNREHEDDSNEIAGDEDTKKSEQKPSKWQYLLWPATALARVYGSGFFKVQNMPPLPNNNNKCGRLKKETKLTFVWSHLVQGFPLFSSKFSLFWYSTLIACTYRRFFSSKSNFFDWLPQFPFLLRCKSGKRIMGKMEEKRIKEAQEERERKQKEEIERRREKERERIARWVILK